MPATQWSIHKYSLDEYVTDNDGFTVMYSFFQVNFLEINGSYVNNDWPKKTYQVILIPLLRWK
jgi:hypothetical protein